MLHRLTTRTVAQPLTREQLTERLEKKRQQLRTANGEWADDLEMQIRYLEQQLAATK
jgi:hypothetical protein